jgi:hypothetical protein
LDDARLKALVKQATAANMAAWQSRFGPKSLDEKLTEDGKVTLGDRVLSDRVVRPFNDDGEPLSSLLEDEYLCVIDAQGTMAWEATNMRIMAETGRYWWPSTLDVEGRAL